MKKILFLLAFPLNLLAQKDYPALLNTYMQDRANVIEFTGTVLVAKKGKIIYEKAFGMADRELNVPNTSVPAESPAGDSASIKLS